jgi:hypothetical protein
MRWHILRTLIHKELLRHLANRGGIALILLLVVAAMLLSFFGRNQTPAASLGGVTQCMIDYQDQSGWVEHLRDTIPAEMKSRITFRSLDNGPEKITYASGVGAIQIRRAEPGKHGPRFKVWVWYPGTDSDGMAPFEAWFWKESQRYFAAQATRTFEQIYADTGRSEFLPEVEEEKNHLEGGLDPRSAVATSLVMFALFFVCIYLLPSLTCEERERGVLLAQALSPASPMEILAAKFLFYPTLGLALAGLLAGIYNPKALANPILWMSLFISVVGSLGVGLSIASLAKTQRTASMAAMCYMMAVALLMFICQQNHLPGLPYLALEYHCPRIVHAALSNHWEWYHWGNMLGATILSFIWSVSAWELFRRRGWQ